MKIEYDPSKSRKNADERDLPFDMVADFEWETATTVPDIRFKYPEARLVSTGFIGNRLHVACYTPIEGGVRIISFRKANSREIERYVEKTTHR